ncbi:MAG: ABC transporter permease [Armatimonadetes bacterium]|nr:ABC transporter permease [Armatimonadota bacterium]
MTVMFSLTLFGLYVLFNRNVQCVLGQQARQAQISAFLKSDLDEPGQAQLRTAIEALPGVRAVEFVSSEAGFERLRKSLNLEGLEEFEGKSELPAKFEVQPDRPEDNEALAGQLKGLAGVEDVQYGGAIVATLNGLVREAHRVGILGLVLFGIATCAVISNAIRLTIYARRREIRIMQLVGATDGFVRVPFLLEGLFHGILGAGLAVVVSSVLYDLFSRASGQLNPWLRLVSFGELMPQFGLGLVALGMVIGAGSSLLSMHRFLREA